MTAWLLLLVVWVVPFELYGLPSAQIRAIVLGEPFFQVLYALLVISTVGCIVPRVGRNVRRARSGPTVNSRPTDSAGNELTDEHAEVWAARLKRLGFRRVVRAPDFVWGVRNRWAPLCSSAWHLAFVGLVVSMTLYLADGGPTIVKFALTEGETFLGQEQQFVDPDSGDVYARLGGNPLPPLSVERIDVEFFKDMLLFTRLEALMSEGDGQRQMSVGNPLLVDPTTWVAIEDFGYSLDVEFRPPQGESQERVYRTNTFPSGTADTFDSPQLGTGTAARTYRLDVRVFGDYVDDEGAPTIQSFNRSNPYVEIAASRVLANGEMRRVLEPTVMPVGSTVDLGNDAIVIRGMPYYGVFRMVRTPWALAVLISFALVAGFAALRLLFPRIEVLVLASADGGPDVRVNRELYGDTGEYAGRVRHKLRDDRER
ncbi:MAG: cytochrome c biogenesis protein ResB [Anaerosomatales bacterium]|nr:cytochrome c biogenesis protein ResB [Anaerosomatales bacterium]